MKRLILVVLALAVLGTASVALAQGLGPLSSSGVGVGGAAVDPCDTDGFTIAYTTSAGAVTDVTIGGIAEPGCAGGGLSVTLTDASGTAIGGGGPVAVPSMADPGSVVVPIAGAPYAGDVAGFRAVIVGP